MSLASVTGDGMLRRGRLVGISTELVRSMHIETESVALAISAEARGYLSLFHSDSSRVLAHGLSRERKSRYMVTKRRKRG